MTAQTLTATDAAPLSHDGRVIALIGFAHGVSHFFQLLLPALFPWLMPAFGLTFSQIGATMTVFFTLSGFGQAMAGFAVDRFGAVRVLLAGMSCFLAAGLMLALAPNSLALFAAAALAGAGNAVFHPSDFSVLNRRVSHARLGHAFSMHGLSGNLGWAVAPLFLAGLASLAGWRVAAVGAAMLALPAMALLWRYRDELNTPPSHEHEAQTGHGTYAFLRVGAVWLCFAFFFLITAAFGAIQNFSAPVLQHLYGLPLTLAATTLSSYLLAGAGGMFVGGFVARRRSHDGTIAMALTVAALLAVVLAAQVVPAWAVLPTMAGIGFFTGIAGPSRDLLVRRAATARFGHAAFGRIYGFVYSGLDAGVAASPLVFGRFMDHGRYGTVLVGIALFQAAAIATALWVGRE